MSDARSWQERRARANALDQYRTAVDASIGRHVVLNLCSFPFRLLASATAAVVPTDEVELLVPPLSRVPGDAHDVSSSSPLPKAPAFDFVVRQKKTMHHTPLLVEYDLDALRQSREAVPGVLASPTSAVTRASDGMVATAGDGDNNVSDFLRHHMTSFTQWFIRQERRRLRRLVAELPNDRLQFENAAFLEGLSEADLIVVPSVGLLQMYPTVTMPHLSSAARAASPTPQPTSATLHLAIRLFRDDDDRRREARRVVQKAAFVLHMDEEAEFVLVAELVLDASGQGRVANSHVVLSNGWFEGEIPALGLIAEDALQRLPAPQPGMMLLDHEAEVANWVLHSLGETARWLDLLTALSAAFGPVINDESISTPLVDRVAHFLVIDRTSLLSLSLCIHWGHSEIASVQFTCCQHVNLATGGRPISFSWPVPPALKSAADPCALISALSDFLENSCAKIITVCERQTVPM